MPAGLTKDIRDRAIRDAFDRTRPGGTADVHVVPQYEMTGWNFGKLFASAASFLSGTGPLAAISQVASDSMGLGYENQTGWAERREQDRGPKAGPGMGGGGNFQPPPPPKPPKPPKAEVKPPAPEDVASKKRRGSLLGGGAFKRFSLLSGAERPYYS